MNTDIIKILILISILPAVLVAPVEAAGDLILSIEPDTTTVDVSSDFSVSFYAGNDTRDLMGYNVVFSFDPDYLELISVEEGSLPADSGEETFFHYSFDSGTTVEVNGAVLGAVVQTPGCIFTVNFKALDKGSTSLNIEESDLRDDENTQIQHSGEGATVIIFPEIDAEKSSWGKVKSVFK